MRAAVPLVVLLALSGALAALAPVQASAPVCSGVRDETCGGTACVYDRISGEWRCALPIDWECLVWRPCWWPGPLP